MVYDPMLESPARTAFSELIVRSGGELPLDRAAALIASEERGVPPEEALAALDELAASVRMPVDCAPVEAVARLNQRLFQELGFRGDEEDYDAPRNSMLDRVLERRRGLPILLSIVYLEVARRRGLRLHPIGFPAHFVVGVPSAEPVFYVDPFHRGQVLGREAMRARLQKMSRSRVDDATLDPHLQPTPPDAVIARVLNNLKRSFLYRADLTGALRATERLLLLRDSPEQHRDRGLILLHLRRHAEAEQELDSYLCARPTARDRKAVERALADARAMGKRSPSAD